MTKKFKMTAATLKKAGKELEEILVPTDDDGNPLKIAVKDQEEMKAKIIEGGKELTIEDEISANLTSVLAELGVSIGDGEETDSKEASLTWDIVNTMNKNKLIVLCEERDLVTDSEDYDELKDFRVDVAIELEIEVPETVEEGDDEIEIKQKETEITNENDKSEVEETDDDEEVDLGVLVAGTKKLVHLKEICEIHDDFKKLRKGLKKYKGLSGPRELKPKMLKLLRIEPEEVKVTPKPKVESNPEKKESATPKKDKKVKEIEETETTKTTESKEKKGTKTEFVAALVKEGKYTLNEIVEKATTEMGCSVGSVRTMINHGKNEKHNSKYKPFNGKLIKAIMVFED